MRDTVLEQYLAKMGFLRDDYLDEETGKWEEYKTAEYIEQVNSDTLYVLTARKPYKIGFLYLSPKALKEKVTPFSGQFDER